MSKFLLWAFLLIFTAITTINSLTAQTVQDPKSYFGFTPGDDYKLFDYQQLIAYLTKLDEASDRVKLFAIGESPLGNTMYVLAVSSPENLHNIDRLKAINKELSSNAGLTSDEIENFCNEGRAFVIATMSMHASEVAPSQSVPLLAYELATTKDQDQLFWLDNTVLMIVPSHNPDGMDMVVHHYWKYLGTKYEKTSLPGVYNKYIGHDNNRDFVTLTQSDTRAISQLFSHDWFPQVMVEKHQMGSSGVRYFVPQPHDPIADNVDASIYNWMGVFGANMMRRMTADSLKGVTQRYLFDDYWPGHTETCVWKNTIGMLTEGASAAHATPVFVEKQELSVYGKGLGEYKKSINMPLPWSGGWWHLGDLVQYERSSLWAILETAALNKKEILKQRAELTHRMVMLGQTTAPYYYVLPAKQHDEGELNALVMLLLDHGVKVFRLTEEFQLKDRHLLAGDIVVPLAQPFRSFVKEVIEKQDFPLRHYLPDGPMIEPYDITSWSLPLHFGLDCSEIDVRNQLFEALLHPINQVAPIRLGHQAEKWGLAFDLRNNESYKAAFKAFADGLKVYRTEDVLKLEGQTWPKGSFIVQLDSKEAKAFEGLTVNPVVLTQKPEVAMTSFAVPRIGLVETWFHDMDAGWTRFIFDQYGIQYKVFRPADLAKGVPENIDLLVFPSSEKTILLDGKYGKSDDYYTGNYPPEYMKGMGKDGLSKLMKWINDGGKVVSWGESAELFEGLQQIQLGKEEKEEFRLPFSNIGDYLAKKGLNIPGSLMSIRIDPDSPFAAGMPAVANVFSRGNPVFKTSIPSFDMDRRIVATYANKNVLVSGFAEKDELLKDKAALIWLKKGKGELVLFGFNPQFRSNTHGVYKLLFNALLNRNLTPKTTD